VLIDEYRTGQCERVWRGLRELDAAVRSPEALPDALAVARETMTRVRHNVALVAERLRAAGYAFSDPGASHVQPSGRDHEMIAEIEAKIGPLPLSFRAFHEVVGSVNFCQSRGQLVKWSDGRRQGASEIQTLGEEDPLVVGPLSRLYDDVVGDGVTDSKGRKHRHHARYNWRPGGENRWYYCFAPDEFHKANYSGGEDYNLFVPDGGADFRIRDLFLGEAEDEEEDREWFVDYLRNVFRGGGFRGKYDHESDECRKRIPSSPLIHRLSEG
jgi:hypothetical protein